VTIGDGPARIVVISGGDAFVRRPDAKSAQRIGRLIPSGFTAYILGYDPATRPSAEELTAATADFMRERTGPALLAGISFGGFVAMRVASLAPELVRGLVLISTAHRFSAEGRVRVAEQLAAIERGDLDAMVRPFIGLFRRRRLNLAVRLAMWLRRGSIGLRMNDPEFVAHMLKMALTCSDAPMPAVRTPALILLGERDQFFDVAAARETAAGIAGARLVTFARETHMLAIERASAVRQAIGRLNR